MKIITFKCLIIIDLEVFYTFVKYLKKVALERKRKKMGS